MWSAMAVRERVSGRFSYCSRSWSIWFGSVVAGVVITPVHGTMAQVAADGDGARARVTGQKMDMKDQRLRFCLMTDELRAGALIPVHTIY